MNNARATAGNGPGAAYQRVGGRCRYRGTSEQPVLLQPLARGVSAVRRGGRQQMPQVRRQAGGQLVAAAAVRIVFPGQTAAVMSGRGWRRFSSTAYQTGTCERRTRIIFHVTARQHTRRTQR